MQEELEREWNRSPTNRTIVEENDDDYDDDDDGETVYPDGQVVSDDNNQDDDVLSTFRHYDDVDREAAVKIQSNYRGYRTRRHMSERQY